MDSIIYISMDSKVLILCYLGYKCHVTYAIAQFFQVCTLEAAVGYCISLFLCFSVFVFVRMYMCVHVLSVSLLIGSTIYSQLILCIP